MHTPKTYKDYLPRADSLYVDCLFTSGEDLIKAIAGAMADVANNTYDEAIIDLGRLNHVG